MCIFPNFEPRAYYLDVIDDADHEYVIIFDDFEIFERVRND